MTKPMMPYRAVIVSGGAGLDTFAWLAVNRPKFYHAAENHDEILVSELEWQSWPEWVRARLAMRTRRTLIRPSYMARFGAARRNGGPIP